MVTELAQEGRAPDGNGVLTIAVRLPVLGLSWPPEIDESRLLEVYRKMPNAGSMVTQVGPVEVEKLPTRPAPESDPSAVLMANELTLFELKLAV